jgi:PIN domain nuclease of toxin-antitoxin system
MKVLLDTHLLLWAAGQPDRLPAAVRELIGSSDNEPYFSAASIWEVVIKSGLGREDFKLDSRVLRRGLLDNGYAELVIGSEHLLAIDNLPALHRDPFDRVLIAQAQVEGITLLTADQMVARYPGPVRLVV